ncbi:MAG TPA: carbohydrate kinase family protein [Ktedonobacteraceae bacterium]|jgi:sugar/nucleoside kinase (ribokinase family)|nr:carbohydrate kinase family protein [Ktedonobacteraceae bacterium]
MAIRFLVIGGITIDTLLGLGGEEHSRWKQGLQAGDEAERQGSGAIGAVVCGGNAIYAGIGAAIWADQVSDIGLVGCIGADYPRAWIAALRASGMNLAGIRELDRPHALTWQASYDRLGRRHECETGEELSAEARAHFLPVADEQMPQEYLGAEAALCCQYELDRQYPSCQFLYERGIRIFLDPDETRSAQLSRSGLRRFLQPVEVFLPSEREVPRFLSRYLPFQPGYLAHRLGRYGPGIVVLKLGQLGCLVYDRTHRACWQLPPWPGQVLDPTGAGDAYCGGFMVSYIQTGDPYEGALRGTVSASFVIEDVGALPALQALPRLRQEAPGRLEQMRRLVHGRVSCGSVGATA